jgi:hypothetical protein
VSKSTNLPPKKIVTENILDPICTTVSGLNMHTNLDRLVEKGKASGSLVVVRFEEEGFQGRLKRRDRLGMANIVW